MKLTNRYLPSIRITLLLVVFQTSLFSADSYDPDRFETEVLVPASNDALQLEVLPNGDVVFIEFWGQVKRWHSDSGKVTTLGRIPTHAKGEVGLLGMAVAKNFLKTGHLYVLFCPAENSSIMRVSRFTAEEDRSLADTEIELLSFPYDTEHVFHMGGAMWMDGQSDLHIGTGDNSHHSPGLPVDMRLDWKNWDSFRSAANTRDYRGKILRIHPEADGSYSIPKDNLFPNGKDGLAEIYAMGIRNPFRISVDDSTGTLYIGDVGPNISAELGIEPAGYDEINATKEACNFGWPSFIGPNEALPVFDFENNTVIELFDPRLPRNYSPRNTGIKNLPPAKPALIWYPTETSKLFPSLGSGGRSIMAGPVYHYDESNPSPTKLPIEFDGRLFIYEWMRNWIKTVNLDNKIPMIESFLPNGNLRRPIDMKLGPDGALYMIEYGDQWWENNDSRLVRLVYRRGNRTPVAKLKSTQTAGKQPLTIIFDANESYDLDGDPMTFTWDAGGVEAGSGSTFEHTFKQAGTYNVSLKATDSSRASSETSETIQVGNARPRVRFVQPVHGSFFDWGKEIHYQVEVDDEDSETVDESLVAVQGQYLNRRFLNDDEEAFVHPGLALMRESTCFACHLSDAPSAGPSYEKVAAKYANDPTALERLAHKILTGGTGTWGELPMPPHPQHTIDQTRQMVSWVLLLTPEAGIAPKLGASGFWSALQLADEDNRTAPPEPGEVTRTDGGVLVLTAEYTDKGALNLSPLRGESSIVLHSRKKKAALYDENVGMEYVDHAYGETGLLGHFEDGDYMIWRDLNLDGISKIKVRAGSLSSHPGRIELRDGSNKGNLLASIQVSPTGEGEFIEIPAKLNQATGLTDVCVVGRFDNPAGQVLGLNWIKFQ